MLIKLQAPSIANHSTGGSQIDHATASWAGQTFSAKSKSGIVPAMARVLIAAGCPDQPWQAARAGVVVMHGPSLAGVAGVAVSDPDNGAGPRFTKFREFQIQKDAA